MPKRRSRATARRRPPPATSLLLRLLRPGGRVRPNDVLSLLRALRAGRLRGIWLLVIGAVVVVSLLSSLIPTAEDTLPCQVTRVVDGDTVRLDCGPGQDELRVRLACIDAPEVAQRPWGERSTAHLQRLAGDRVDLVHLGTDRYQRVIGRLLDGDGADINLQMVRDGWAAVYPQYCDERAYFEAEATARARALGIWASDGLHQRPWESR